MPRTSWTRTCPKTEPEPDRRAPGEASTPGSPLDAALTGYALTVATRCALRNATAVTQFR